MQNIDVNATSDGDNTVIAAVAGKRIYVHGFILSGIGTLGSANITDGAGGAVLARLRISVSGIPNTIPPTNIVLFAGSVGAALVINNAASLDTVGRIWYVQA